MLKSKIEKEGNRKHIKGTQSQETQILINGCLGDSGLLKGDSFWKLVHVMMLPRFIVSTPDDYGGHQRKTHGLSARRP